MSLAKIKDLFHFEKGTLQSTKATPGEYDFITAATDWKTHNEYTHNCEALIFAAAASGSLGRTHYVNGKFISSDLCFILTPKDEEKYPIDIKFYHLIFNAFKEGIVRNTKSGTSKEAIGLTVFGNYKLPYFDIEKQQEAKETILKVQELSHSLDNELSKQFELINNLRQVFLKEAMQGKLVEQDSNDEPASMLLDKINHDKVRFTKEKNIKKQNQLHLISENEVPFAIPQSWLWTRLGNCIYETESGKSPNCKNTPATGKEWGVIKTTAIQEMFFLENENKVLPDNFKVNPKHVIKEGDLLITRAGPKNRVGIVCNVENITLNLILSDKTIRILHNPNLLNTKFIAFALNSPLVKIEVEKKMTGMADSQVNITQDNIKSFPIPFPPINEQNKIVLILNELMKICDDLQNNINSCLKQNNLLLQQFLSDVLGIKPSVNIEKQIEVPAENKLPSKFDSNTLFMEIQELLKIHGKLQALELWQMSKFYGKTDAERNIDGFYAELKKLIEKEKVVKETEKGYLEVV